MQEREQASGKNASTIVSIDEAIELYHHEHIVMQVIEFDERGNPSRGIVVAHAADTDEVSKQFAAIDPGPDLPKEHYCFFSGYRRIHTTEQLHHAIQAIEEETESDIDVPPQRPW